MQNKALRWINGDVPPYETSITDLQNIYHLEPLNVRNFRLDYSMWEKIRSKFPDHTQRYEDQEFQSTHAWRPMAYIKDEDRQPEPIYGYIRPRNQDDNAQSDDEEAIN